jgi:hypothetical protein
MYLRVGSPKCVKGEEKAAQSSGFAQSRLTRSLRDSKLRAAASSAPIGTFFERFNTKHKERAGPDARAQETTSKEPRSR